jgi:glycosyltransferase involved in cell wall biosynthesis
MAEQPGINVFFAYRYFNTYQMGVNRDLSEKVKAIPLSLLSNSTFFHQLNQTVSNRLMNLVIKLPFWLLQKIGIYAFYDYLILRKTILKINPDLIHVNNGGYPASFVCQTAVLAAKHSGVDKIILHINNPAQMQGPLLDKVIDKRINQYTDYFITASKQASISLAHNRFFNIHKLVQIYNTVENPAIVQSREEICKVYNIDADKFILCEVAFLSQRKGQIHVLKALHKIKEIHPDIFSRLVLFLVGDGEDYHKLRRYCDINGLQNVIFTGYQTNYVDFIACSDVFLLPSIGDEDMPLVILSAMNLSKPIIASDVAGIAEEIENLKSGILVKVEELDSLYLEIVKLYGDGDLRNFYAANALKRFNDHFSQSRVYSDIKALYSKLLTCSQFSSS